MKETPLLHLVREHFFTPAPSLGNDAWVLSLESYNPSPTIQAYQQRVKQMESDRRWSPF